MKSIVFAAVFSSALVFVLGQLDSEQVEVHKKVEKKEEEAAKYCNELFPVSEDMHIKFARSVIKGEPLPMDFHSEETCHLNCYLEQLGFFDANGDMDVREIYGYLIEKLPDLKVNRQILRIFLFQTYRMVKGLNDKCEKAFIVYYRFVEAVMTATMDSHNGANAETTEKQLFEVLDGKSTPKELDVAWDKSLKNAELFFDLTILK
ncbi:uncharacterized protein LOC135843530 [Planococcus citri]|uniref:uncharacterized protein LOC135843530 n=1 Tax=Planococcus citri TaxID=170843 RepID=UPI0031F856C1